MKYEKVDAVAIEGKLSDVPGWNLEAPGDAIVSSFKFSSFAAAFGFMAECAIVAERLNHHPEWFNVYSRVDVRLTTHATSGLTTLDFELAAAMNKAASSHGVQLR